MTRTFLAATALAVALCTPALAAEDAHADLIGPDGTDMGRVTLTETPHGVLISVTASGLVPGAHGFHIHEIGACTPDFEAAGDHFNPGGEEHGIKNEAGRHAGDLPNIHAAEDGTAAADILTDTVTLADSGETALFDADGSAVMIHENADSYGADAGAGGRVACGVIAR